MYKNLAPEALELSCSQNELIELTLTHRFGGLCVDLATFQDTVDERSLDYAVRFLKSAPIKVSTALLPFALDASEGKFRARMVDLPKFIESAEALKCDTLIVRLAAGSVDLPYHENYELHRRRIDELAAVLQESGLRLGLTFQAAPQHRAGMANPFVCSPDGLVAFLKTTSANNLSIVVDVWDWTVGGGSADLLEGLTANQIADVRLADLPAGFDAEQVSDADRLLPGATDVVDIASYLSALKQMEYQGPLTATPHASQLSGKRDEIVGRIAQCVDSSLAKLDAPPVTEDEASEVTAGADG